MGRTLAGFVRALRAAGADASTAEALDAARTVALMGYADRATLKAALGVVLAKSEAEKALHDEVFELYFQPPARAEQRPSDDSTGPADESAGAQAPLQTGDAELDALLALIASAQGGDRSEGSDDDGAAEPGAALTAALQRAAQAVGVDDIRFSSQTAYLSRRMLELMGIAPLEARLLARLGEPDAAALAEAQALSAARDTLQRHARALVEQRFELFGKPATDAFLTEVAVTRQLGNIGRMSPPDIGRMKVAVARMARRLAIKHSQRRRIKLHGQLDFRRTLRSSAGHDGVPFKLFFKTRRRDKPRLVVVCDVSASVAPHVRFLLMFLYALQGAVTDLHTFAFSNRLMDVEAPLERLPFDDAMELILREVGSGATDYGAAWQDLHDRHWQAIDRRTTVLVLGDGRSNGGDPRLDLFTELANRAKRLVWLCPEPPGRWGTGDSCMLQYRPHCTHASHVATAADLERAIDEALEAYA
ncbi:MAG: VWA domain-containing protein [Microbacteriaceae bacterium]|nr:VWA domain-containing protein [Burkholderiaceae bacterium]